MNSGNMRLAAYANNLKNVFNKIQQSFEQDNTAHEEQPRAPDIKKLSAIRAQAIKDEVEAEETHNWTIRT